MYRTVSLAHWWVSSGTTFGNGLKWIAYTTKRFPISGGLPTEVPYQPAYSLLAYLNLITVWMALLISSFVFLSYAVSERVLPYINKKTRKLFNIRFEFKSVPSLRADFIISSFKRLFKIDMVTERAPHHWSSHFHCESLR